MKNLKIVSLFIILIAFFAVILESTTKNSEDYFTGFKDKILKGKDVKKEIIEKIAEKFSVEGVSASDGEYTEKVRIIWNELKGAEKYYIYRSTSPEGPYSEIGNTNSNFYDDVTALQNTIYYYKIRAYSSNLGYSDYSSYDSGYRELYPPTGVSASDATNTNRIIVTWNNVTNSQKYYVYRSKSPDGPYSEIGNTTSTSYTDTTALKSVMYYYKIRAYSSVVGYSKYSSYDSGYRGLLAPTNVSASDGTYTNKIKITWNGVPYGEKYYIYRATTTNGPYSEISNTYGISYFDTTALQETIYYYKIRAYSSTLGYSEYSLYDIGYRTLFFRAIKISAGEEHSLALKNDGTLWATGDNYFGELGTGDNSYRNVFVKVLSNVSAIAAGGRHSLALKNDGTLWATGCGYGNVFVKVLSNVSAIAAGGVESGLASWWHSLALKNDGTLWATGDNTHGPLGTGDYNNRNVFVKIYQFQP